MNYSSPSATKEELDYPGCILPVIRIAFLLYSGIYWSVIIKAGIGKPDKDFNEGSIFEFGSLGSNFNNRLYGYGMQYANSIVSFATAKS